MQTLAVKQVYEQYIAQLSIADQLTLITMISQQLTDQTLVTIQPEYVEKESQHSIMELHGLGKEIWEGIDAQEYVNTLRQEWGAR